jgi:AcrR family transcriptional regulator
MPELGVTTVQSDRAEDGTVLRDAGTGRDNRRPPTVKFPAAVDADVEDVIRALDVWSGATAQPAPKNKRGERTRQQLIESATRAFVRQGFVDCSVEDIIQEADISRGTFYAHFKSKKAVFAAIIGQSIEGRLTATDVSHVDVPLVRDRIELSVRLFLDSFHRAQGLSMVIEQAAYHDPSFRRIRLIIRDSFARRIAKGIRRQQARGIADAEIDPAEAGLAIVSMMTYYAQTELGWRDRQPSEEMVELLTRFWVRGIGLQEDAPVSPN